MFYYFNFDRTYLIHNNKNIDGKIEKLTSLSYESSAGAWVSMVIAERVRGEIDRERGDLTSFTELRRP